MTTQNVSYATSRNAAPAVIGEQFFDLSRVKKNKNLAIASRLAKAAANDSLCLRFRSLKSSKQSPLSE